MDIEIDLKTANDALTTNLQDLLKKPGHDKYLPEGSNASMIVTNDKELLETNDAVWDAILSLTKHSGQFAAPTSKLPVCEDISKFSESKFTQYLGKIINNYFVCLYQSRIDAVSDPDQKNRITALVLAIIDTDKSKLVTYKPSDFPINT